MKLVTNTKKDLQVLSVQVSFLKCHIIPPTNYLIRNPVDLVHGSGRALEKFRKRSANNKRNGQPFSLSAQKTNATSSQRPSRTNLSSCPSCCPHLMSCSLPYQPLESLAQCTIISFFTWFLLLLLLFGFCCCCLEAFVVFLTGIFSRV